MECHDSSVFLIQKLPLSITEALLKSMEWSWDHAWFAIDKGSFLIRKTLELWHSMVTPNTDNNSCPLPGQYNILFTHIHTCI